MSTLGAPIKKNPKKTTPKKETPTVDTNQTKQEEPKKEEPKNEEKKTEVTKTEETKTEEKKTETPTPTKTTLGGAPTKTTLGGVKTTLGGVKTSLGGAKTTLGGVPTKTTLGGSTAKTTLGGITPTKTPGNQVPPKENKDQPNDEIKPTTTSDTTTTEGTNEPTSTEETLKEKEKKKKKKKKTEKPEEKEKPEEIEKPEDLKTKPKKVAKGKALVGKLLAEKLNKKKEEEERLRREEEERLKKEEEERIKREEEEKKKKELELERARINKIEREKRKKEEEIRQKELQRLEKMKKYGLKQPTKSTPPLTNPSQSSDPSSSTDTTTNNPSDKPQEKKKKNKKTKTSKFHERLEEEKRIREEEEKQNNPQLSTPSVDNWEDITVDVPTETVKEEVEVGDNWEEMLENDQIVIPSTNTNTNTTNTNTSSPSTTTQTQIEETKKENPSSSSSTSSNEKGGESSNETVSTTTTNTSTSSDTDKSFSSSNELRSPIICVLGHVDVGKTKILDKIRQTHVQDDEAGGITQQIGATWFPIEALKERVSKVITKKQFTLDVPGLLIIDTPGHESFTNLRSRGSSLCDLAILVVDIMHGIEQQTIESIKLLQMKGTPFIVALNKIDRIYGWNKMEGAAFNTTFKKQPKNTQLEFKNLLNRTILHFAEQSINAKLYKEIKDFNEWVALVPTSAHTGEGIPDLLLLITQYAQKKLKNTIAYEEQFEATVLEVKPVEGIGKTIDVIIVNGVLKKGDKIVLCGMNGAIVTNVKAILTPHPLKELRVKNEYLQHDSIKAAQGVKIVATGTDLEKAVPGSPLFVVENEKQLEEATQNVMKDYEKLKANINKEGQGVYVNSSTLGALEALLHFLKSSKIPVCDFSIGPVHKKDVMKAGTMIERKMKKYAVILAFDVKVTPEAELEAKKLGVTIMTADIIYHLTDQFELYLKKLDEEERKEHEGEAVFPCVLEIIPEYIFNSKNPIVVGVKVLDGELRRGTPICIPGKDMDLGVVSNIQFNNQDREFGKKGEEVAVSISPNTGAQHYSYGRHFTSQDKLFSKISRRSIDAMKMFFMEDVKKWLELFKKLKILFNID